MLGWCSRPRIWRSTRKRRSSVSEAAPPPTSFSATVFWKVSSSRTARYTCPCRRGRSRPGAGTDRWAACGARAPRGRAAGGGRARKSPASSCAASSDSTSRRRRLVRAGLGEERGARFRGAGQRAREDLPRTLVGRVRHDRPSSGNVRSGREARAIGAGRSNAVRILQSLPCWRDPDCPHCPPRTGHTKASTLRLLRMLMEPPAPPKRFALSVTMYARAGPASRALDDQ